MLSLLLYTHYRMKKSHWLFDEQKYIDGLVQERHNSIAKRTGVMSFLH